MEIKLIAHSNNREKFIKDDAIINIGMIAGICYSKLGYETLLLEDTIKSKRRAENILSLSHDSPFDHLSITLHLKCISKAFAMLLNDEQFYTTSERSLRYVNIEDSELLSDREKELYVKWRAIYINEITKYSAVATDFYTERRISTLANENARYFLSIYSKTSTLIYTTTYRQINIIIGLLKLAIESKNEFILRLTDEIEEFIKLIKELELFDKDLSTIKKKNRTLKLIDNTNSSSTNFIDTVYQTSYTCSYACLAQLMRHRTIRFSFNSLDECSYFIPKILENNLELKEMYIEDMNSVKELVPQGMLVNVFESGHINDLILLTLERHCTMAQLEIDLTSRKKISQLYSIASESVKKVIEPVLGARCLSKLFICQAPCHNIYGIKGTRLV